uniref:NADH-ubiquinone oxidoreductase chain 4 n=1 Tax=Cyrtotrachelus buqueti TaxID=1892066 RepID=A0A346T607_9CUCU|nr:NADH dehydrogenase subunit 4 [Cyrtotrachelus buqueti]AXU05690.1 NADH dehydrogenase subunit 4 [Cyrtotrachelus buqueti]
MKFLLALLFLIPISFFKNFWVFPWCLLLMSLLFLMNASFNELLMNISYYFGMDLLSFSLIILSFLICLLMFVASESVYKENNFLSLFSLINVILLISLFLAFSTTNMFLFYLFFEISLIPTFLLIVGWGYQPERISAGNYLLFYTLLMSLPMLMGLFYVYMKLNTLEFYFFTNLSNHFLYFCINMVFFVKMPMYMIHLWLPKAHVEAPISGSMILAGVMLKLGGYGLMRFMKLFLFVNKIYSNFFISISLVGGVIVSLICLRQSDMKSLIAYSSVAHMGLVLSGILTLNLLGMWGSLVLMLAHGLCSSGLFCLANISYERTKSRSIYLNKGMINILPSLSLWWFLLSASNMAAPPSLNLLGEIMLINSLVVYSNFLMLFLSMISFFSAAYSLFLFSYTQHGMISSNLYPFMPVSIREYYLLMMHWVPLNVLMLKSELIMFWI